MTHEAWFIDLVPFCRTCGAMNSKKGTMQKPCPGMPSRQKGRLEPYGLKVIRLMTQGFLPQASRSDRGPRMRGNLYPDPL